MGVLLQCCTHALGAPLWADCFNGWVCHASVFRIHAGALPVHDGLWQSAMETADSLGARLAVEHCCHEARGLDVLPQTVARFRSSGDAASADLLEDVIYAEEISHCAAGVRWMKHLHAVARGSGGSSSEAELDAAAQALVMATDELPTWAAEAREHERIETWFHALIRAHFHGLLKPPFNHWARGAAGFLPEWYEPLSREKQSCSTAKV